MNEDLAGLEQHDEGEKLMTEFFFFCELTLYSEHTLAKKKYLDA